MPEIEDFLLKKINGHLMTLFSFSLCTPVIDGLFIHMYGTHGNANGCMLMYIHTYVCTFVFSSASQPF